MAHQIETPEFSTLTAAADYSSNQYHLVAITASAATVTLASAQGQVVHGVLTNDPTSGQAACVQHFGIAKVVAGAAVSIGDDLITNSSGRCISAASNEGYLIGVALSAASTNGDIITVMLRMRQRRAGTFSFPITLSSMTGTADVVTSFTPGFSGRIISTQFIQGVPVTTGSKAATLNLEIGTVDLTGGTIGLTSALCTPLGARIAGAAVTAGNSFSASDTISLESSAVTAFAEGTGTVYVSWVER